MSNFQARDHTAIAVISWLDENKQTQARLYTQDYSGNIRESCYDGKSWSADAARNVVAKARRGTAIAACRFQGMNHVFYFKDADGNYINGVYEVAPGEWREDSIHESGLRTTVVGYLAALPSPQDQPGPRGTHYTLYYQGGDQRIYRMLSSGVESKWLNGGSFGGRGEASFGTGLAATNFEDTDSDGIYPATRIFYQTSDGSSVTYVTVGRDFDSFKHPDDQDLINRTKGLINVVTPLCAISTGDAGNPSFQLYARNKDVSVGEWGYYSRGWKHENRLGIPFPYATDIAMFRSSDPTIHKIYVQVQRTDRPEILEYSAENAFGPWDLSTVVPT